MPRQEIRQLRMVRQCPLLGRLQFRHTTVEHSVNILPGQARGIEQSVDVGVLRVDRPGKSAPRGMIPGMNHIGRGTDAGAAVTAKVDQRQHRSGLRGDAHPNALRDLLQTDLAFATPREPISHYRFDKGSGEVGRRIKDRVAVAARGEPGISVAGSERRCLITAWYDTVVFGKRRLEEERPNPAPRIAGHAHVKVEPKPGAASRTSSIRPAFSNSRGSAAVSSNGHSWVRNAQASSGSPTAAATSAKAATTRPGPRICAAGMFSPRFVDLQARRVPLSTQS